MILNTGVIKKLANYLKGIENNSIFKNRSPLSYTMEYVKNRWIKENSVEKRDYQEAIAESSFRANTLCVLPTAMGKTIISLLLVTKALDRDMNKKIMFMAPTRPLVEQHKNTFEKFLKLGLNIVAITGKLKPEEREKAYKFNDIIFATPQCIANDLKRKIIHFGNFSLLVVDEAQHSVGNYAYTKVAGSFIEQTKHTGLVIGLTASPSGKYSKIYEIKKTLFIKNVEIRSEKDDDVKDFVKPIDINYVEIELTPKMETLRVLLEEMKNDKIKTLMSWKVIFSPYISKSEAIALQKKLAARKTGFSFAAISALAEIIKIDYALELLETQTIESLKNYINKILESAELKKSKADARLAKDPRFQKVLEEAKKLESHPKMEKLKEIVKSELENPENRLMIFAQFRSTVKFIKEALEKIDGCKPVLLVGQAGEDGLTQKDQISLIKLYESGEYNTLITTSIGEEGIHLGSATTAIFYEAVPSEIRSIQRRGRVGREQKGKLFVLITKKTRDQIYYWTAYNKEKKMKRIMESMKNQSDLNKFGD
jgi:Fanconi anemia group M protein